MLTVPAAIAAGRRAANLPVVATVRDYWPVCYWSTLIVDPGHDAALPRVHGGEHGAVPEAARGRRVAGRAAA